MYTNSLDSILRGEEKKPSLKPTCKVAAFGKWSPKEHNVLQPLFSPSPLVGWPRPTQPTCGSLNQHISQELKRIPLFNHLQQGQLCFSQSSDFLTLLNNHVSLWPRQVLHPEIKGSFHHTILSANLQISPLLKYQSAYKDQNLEKAQKE